jgi:acetyltransferase-like isoleucine patch superfamily enzyme
MLYYRIDLILPSEYMWSFGIRGLLDWLLQVQWMVLFLVSKVFRSCVSPFLRLATVVVVKSTVFRGCFRSGSLPPRHSWAALARWWVSVIFTDGQLCGVAPLINVHSELHSAILRLLGAKVGKHVFWPLSGLVTPYHDFVEVGDDVIWGAHHALIVADDVAARPIVLEAGSNPLDRVVLSPGSRVCRNALIGTGSFVKPGVAVPAGCKYLGTTILEKSEERAKAPSTKPYGRACEGGAVYFLIPDWLWPAILIPLKAVETIFAKSPFLLALFFADICTRHFHRTWYDYPPSSPHAPPSTPPFAPSTLSTPPAPTAIVHPAGLFYGSYHNDNWEASTLRHKVPLAEFFLVLAVFYVLADYSVKLLGVWLDIAAKWAIVGRRQPGPHRFDQSSYSQRWHFYLSFHGFSKSMLERWVGTSMIPWYYRLLGSSIGKDVCFLQGVSPMFSREPDLTNIGDNVCINNSIIRCHSNALGVFELQPCVLGDRVTLRSGTVVQGGARLENDSILLERTLAMPGETVNKRMAMQGWPADIMVPARIRMPVTRENAGGQVNGGEDSLLTAPLLMAKESLV